MIVMQQGDVVGVNTDQLQPDQQQPQQPPQPGQPPQQQPQPTFTGPITVDLDTSYVDLTLIQPERVFRDPNATYVQDGQYFTYEEDKSRGELILEGVDPEQAESLTVDYRFRSQEEDNSRKSHDSSWTRRQQHKRADENELLTVYYTWTWADLSEYDLEYDEEEGSEMNQRSSGGTGSGEINPEGLGLYKIRWAHGEILKDTEGNLMVERVTEIPAFEWTEFKIRLPIEVSQG